MKIKKNDLKNIMLSLNNLSIKFSGGELFAGINAQIAGGELLAVTGRNGAGKSTLLKIILGITHPCSGTVRLTVDRREISQTEKMSFMGMVSPELVLYNNLSGFENMVFFNRLRNVKLSGENLNEFFKTTGLLGQEHNQVRFYSTGMRQRLKLAVMLSLNPPVWILDEPSSNLDESGRKLVSEIIEQKLKTSAIVVLATNNPEETMYAKNIIKLG